MHICFICREYPPSLRGGGIASYIKEVSHGLHDAGHQVTVIAASDDTRLSSEEEDGGVRVIRLAGGDFLIPQVEGNSLLKKFRIFYRFYSYRKKVRKIVRSLQNVDVIEVPDFGAESLCLQKLHIPIVMRLHTPSMFDRKSLGIVQFHGWRKIFAWTGKMELDLIRKSPYISSCSMALAEWAVLNLRIEPIKIKVIFNPVSLPSNIERIDREKCNVPSVVFVGTISAVKGCGDLFEAGRLLSSQGKAFNMYLYGKLGAYACKLKQMESSNPWFHVMGKVKREDVYGLYKNATVVCLPSWWDNMPMTCLEAMGVGAIVLGSSSGGMAEIIDDGKSGYLVDPKNPHLLAESLSKIIDMKEGRKAISQNAQKRIRESFSMDVIVQQMIDYYNYVISDFKKKSR